ncbi:MAG: shikimate kinase [Phycisphaerae bacterium]
MSNIVLMGLRGSGKSAIGSALAARLGWEFVDTDELVERTAGRSVAEIFARDGEPRFREFESDALRAALAGDRRVVSIGGGAVLAPANRERLRAAAVCVWLTAPPAELLRRIAADPRSVAQRPPLTTRSPLEELTHLADNRNPLYAELASHTIATEGRALEQLVDDIMRRLRNAHA